MVNKDGSAWSALKHAKGKADDLPVLLDGIVGGDEGLRHASHMEIEQRLTTPGKWYSATATAATALVERLGRAGAPGRERVLALLADVMAAHHALFLGTGVDMRDADVKKRYARAPAKDVAKAVLGAKDRAIQLLADDDAKVRAGAAFLLAFLSEAAADAIPALRARLPQEKDAAARASVILAIAFASRYLGKPVGPDAADLSSSEPLVRGAAALAAASIADAPDEAWIPALRGFVRSRAGRDVFPWAYARLAEIVSSVLARLGDGGTSLGARALSGAVVDAGPPMHAEWAMQGDWAREAMRLVMEENGQPRLPDDLNDIQRAVLADLSRFDVRTVFRSFGLPDGARDRRRMLGIDPPGPLERVIPMTIAGEEKRLPLWRSLLLLQAANETQPQVEARLAEALSPLDLLATLAELAQNTYGCAPLPPNRLFELLETVGAEAASWARPFADEIASRGLKPGLGPAVGKVALLAIVRSLPKGEKLDAKYDGVLSFGAPLPVTREIMEAIPLDRRERILVTQITDSGRPANTMNITLNLVLPMLDLAPTDGVLAVLRDALAVETLMKAVGPFDAKPLRDRSLAQIAEIAKSNPALAETIARANLGS